MSFGFFSGTQFDETILECVRPLAMQGRELVSIFDIHMFKGGSKYVIAVLKRRME